MFGPQQGYIGIVVQQRARRPPNDEHRLSGGNNQGHDGPQRLRPGRRVPELRRRPVTGKYRVFEGEITGEDGERGFHASTRTFSSIESVARETLSVNEIEPGVAIVAEPRRRYSPTRLAMRGRAAVVPASVLQSRHNRRCSRATIAVAFVASQPIAVLSLPPGEMSSIEVINSMSAGPEWARAASKAAPKSAVAVTREAARPYARARATKSGLASAVAIGRPG